MLQPFDFNAEEKSKHKFMIQSTFVPDGETSLDTIVSFLEFSVLTNDQSYKTFPVEEYELRRFDGFEIESFLRNARIGK